jgi:hypothetical protein
MRSTGRRTACYDAYDLRMQIDDAAAYEDAAYEDEELVAPRNPTRNVVNVFVRRLTEDEKSQADGKKKIKNLKAIFGDPMTARSGRTFYLDSKMYKVLCGDYVAHCGVYVALRKFPLGYFLVADKDQVYRMFYYERRVPDLGFRPVFRNLSIDLPIDVHELMVRLNNYMRDLPNEQDTKLKPMEKLKAQALARFYTDFMEWYAKHYTK